MTMTDEASGMLDPFAGGAEVSNVNAERYVLCAMMQSQAAIEMAGELLDPAHFYRPGHQVLFRTMVLMFAAGDGVDPVTLLDRLERDEAVKALGPDGPVYLAELYGLPATTVLIRHYADIILGCAIRRTLARVGQRLVASAYNPAMEPGDAVTAATRAIAQVMKAGAETAGMALDDFLGQEFPGGDWVVPGLIGRQDRVVVVGPEGAGKTMLSHQVAYAAAAGIHPFQWQTAIEPARVLILDFENPPALLQRRSAYMAGIASGHLRWDSSRIVIHSQAQGADLTNPRDAFELARIVGQAKPDLIVAGPVYKMMVGASDDGPATHLKVAGWFDKMRTEHGCAVWIEAHAPLGGEKRVMRPEGSNLWSKWPEFGLALCRAGKNHGGPTSLDVSQFRGHREEGRSWPAWLSRNRGGFGWPWVANYDRDIFDGPAPEGD